MKSISQKGSKGNQDFNFIKEQPHKTTNGEQLQFGHQEIVNSLARIVKNTPSTSFTIGLFGSWGSGKSTIVENLQETLLKEDIPLVIFDVWKHQDDSLRRTFLKELEEQLKKSFKKNFLSAEYNLIANLDKSVKEIEEKPKIKWKELGIYILIGCTLALPAVVFVILMWLILVKGFKIVDISSWSFQTIISIIPIAFLLKFFDKFVDRKKIESTSEKLQDPHEFEVEFTRLLNHMNVSKLVIAFDNLDRVSETEAKSVISTIKTFLEPVDKKVKSKNLAFLIPCDITALRKHIAYDADEFLRKFFNTSIWIPEFYPIELEENARLKLKETQVDALNNEELADLITQVYRSSPRQIIQFINILLAEYILLVEKQSNGYQLGRDFHVDSNILSFSRFLILKDKYPFIIHVISSKKAFIKESITADILEIPENELKEFYRFCEMINYSFEHLSLYITLKHSKQEQNIPGISVLLEHLRAGNDKDIIEESQKFDFSESKTLAAFCDLIKSELENIKNNFTLARYINSLLILSKAIGCDYKQIAYQSIHKNLIRLASGNYNTLSRIQPTLIDSELISKYYATDIKTLINGWLFAIEVHLDRPNENPIEESFMHEYMTFLSDKYLQIPSENISRIKSIVLRSFKQKSELISTILTNKSCQKALLTSDFINEIMLSIDTSNLSEQVLADKTKIITNIDPQIFTENNAVVASEIILTIIGVERENTFENRYTIIDAFFDLARTLFSHFKDSLYSNTFKSKRETIIEETITMFDSYPKWEERITVVSFWLDFVKNGVLSDHQSTIEDRILSYMHTTNASGIGMLLSEESFLDVLLSENSGYFIKIKDVALSDISQFTIMFSFLTRKSDKILFLKELALSNYYSEFIDKIASNHDYIDDDEMFQIILTRINDVDVDSQYKSCDFIEKLTVKIDEQKMIDYLFNLLTKDNKDSQLLGYNMIRNTKLVNIDKKTEIIKRLIDRISDVLNNTEKYFSVLSIAELYSNLDKINQNVFIKSLFDKLVLSTDRVSIRLGLNLLATLQHSSSEWKEHYDKLNTHIETVIDPDLKEYLINATLTLLPNSGIYLSIKKPLLEKHKIYKYYSDSFTNFVESTYDWIPKNTRAEITSNDSHIQSSLRFNRFADSKWIAHKERITDMETLEGGRYLFKREFELPFNKSRVKSAKIYFLVDDHVKLQLNGKEIAKGSKYNVDNPHTSELSTQLKEGMNNLEIEIENIDFKNHNVEGTDYFSSKRKWEKNPYSIIYILEIETI